MSREIPITAESVVSWSETPVATEVDREVVLMNVGRGRCYGLGETGSSVWRRLGSPIRVDDLCRELMLEYHADPEGLTKDVLSFAGEPAGRRAGQGHRVVGWRTRFRSLARAATPSAKPFWRQAVPPN